MRLTTEFRVEGLEGRGGGSEEESEVGFVEVGTEEVVDEAAGVAERAIHGFSCRSRYLTSACENACMDQTYRWECLFPMVLVEKARPSFQPCLQGKSGFTNAGPTRFSWCLGCAIQCQRV